MSEVFDYPFLVHMDETDAYGMVYHANYLKYFDRARSHLLARAYPLSALAEQGIHLLVQSITVDYRRSLGLDAFCEVKTCLTSSTSASCVSSKVSGANFS